MILLNKYFEILSRKEIDALSAEYDIALLPKCDVYEGHFPGNPVCPGVCNIECIKECVMMFKSQSLRYSTIKLCRFTALATPSNCARVKVEFKLTPSDSGYAIQSSISDENQTYLVVKGQLDIIQ